MLSMVDRIVELGAEQMMAAECAVTKQDLKANAQKRLKPLPGNCSVFVRIYDNQRSTVGLNRPLNQKLSADDIDNSAIPKQLRADYLYDGAKPDRAKKPKKTWSLFGEKKVALQSVLESKKIADRTAFLKKLTRAIAQKLEITHYNF